MARTFTKPNTGSIGRRRIVPMMGIDFIAGQIELKGKVVSRDGVKVYGTKPPSMGGRTRNWSFINFLHIDRNAERTSVPSQAEVDNRSAFSNATQSANATMQNLGVVAAVQADFKAGTSRQGVDPNNYATLRGWIAAVRMAQQAAGTSITPTTNTWSWT